MRLPLAAVLLCSGVVAAQTPLLHAQPLRVEKQNLAYRWLEIAQEATAREVDRNGARPTIISRTLGIWATAMYDAWAAYDDKAVGTRLGGKLRRPAAERTLKNKQKAMSHASYRALLDVYPEEKAYLDAELKKLDLNTPQGIGNLAAQAVIDYRHHGGANQLGDEPGSSGVPYSSDILEPSDAGELFNALQLLPGRDLFAVSARHALQLHDLSTLARVTTTKLPNDASPIRGIVKRPGGDWLMVGDSLVDLSTGELKTTIEGLYPSPTC